MSIASPLKLTDVQQDAHKKIISWANRAIENRRYSEFVLGGLAGVGKSVLINEVVATLIGMGHHIIVCAPSAKAGEVLKQKGIPENIVCTIHRLIYRFAGLRDNDYTEEQEPIFQDTGLFSENFGKPDLIILDEASLCDGREHDALSSRDVPILYVGDPGQLPPVHRDPGIMNRMNIFLDKVLRQAEGSPIISLAHKIRNGGAIEKSDADGEIIKVARCDNDALARCYVERGYDTVISARNKTRILINKKIRKFMGRDDVVVVGDRLIANNDNIVPAHKLPDLLVDQDPRLVSG